VEDVLASNYNGSSSSSSSDATSAAVGFSSEAQSQPSLVFQPSESFAFSKLMHQQAPSLQRVPFSISAGLIPIELDKDEHHDSSENLNLALVPFNRAGLLNC
jgi:hypothetical protein